MDCSSQYVHATWVAWLAASGSQLKLGRDLAAEAYRGSRVSAPPPSRLLIVSPQYDPSRSSGSSHDVLTAFLCAADIAFFVWFSGSMCRMQTMHSLVGPTTFIGLVEIILFMRAPTSSTLAALPGRHRLSIGAKNMLSLVRHFYPASFACSFQVDAVVTIQVTLPVKEHIAAGLRKSNTSNMLKVLP